MIGKMIADVTVISVFASIAANRLVVELIHANVKFFKSFIILSEPPRVSGWVLFNS